MVIAQLSLLAHDFIAKRHWQTFHNPKNDVMNLFTESTELAECFGQNLNKQAVADELGDVIFALLLFAKLIGGVDIAKLVTAKMSGNISDEQSITFEELMALVAHKSKDTLVTNKADLHQLANALLVQAGKLADVFIWCEAPKSYEIANKQSVYLQAKLTDFVVHLLQIADVFNLNPSEAFVQKLEKIGRKYPVETSSYDGYEALKNKLRNK